MLAGRAPLWPAAMALGALSITAAAAIRAYAAPAPWHYFAHDQQVYLAIARAPFSSDPMVHHGSGSWRILPPLAARCIGMLFGGPERGFLVLTFATFALLPGACLVWLRSLGVAHAASWPCAAVIAIAPPVVGLLAWDVVRVDSVGLLLLFGATTAVARGQGLWLCVAVALMAFTKETALIGAFFALSWAALVDRRMLPAAVAAAALAFGIRGVLQWSIATWPPFDNLKDFRVVMASMSPVYAARRLLLATAGTWNLILPVVAAGMASRRWGGREVALTGALAVTMVQLLFSTDNERVVAAGYPFVLAWCALQLATMEPRARRWVGVAMVAGQIPWLLEMGRVWPPPLPEGQLPHFPPIRYVEIAIVLISAATAIVFARRAQPRTAPS